MENIEFRNGLEIAKKFNHKESKTDNNSIDDTLSDIEMATKIVKHIKQTKYTGQRLLKEIDKSIILELYEKIIKQNPTTSSSISAEPPKKIDDTKDSNKETSGSQLSLEILR